MIVGVCEMENLLDVLNRAKRKKVFEYDEFEKLLNKIQISDSNLKLDWDDGAGEEWARFFSQNEGLVCMMNSRIGIAFIRKNYKFADMKKNLNMIEIVYVDDYSSDDWFVDLFEIKQLIPELYWHASEGAVNPKCFSLDDLYFATI